MDDFMDDLLKRLQKIRTFLMLDHPFWGTIVAHLKFQIDDSVLIAATDGYKTIWFNSNCQHLDNENLKFVVLHELLHVVFCHPQRKGDRDPTLWNIACDFAINHILINEMELQPPEGVLYDPKYAGKPAEVIYSELVNFNKNAHFSQVESDSEVGKRLAKDLSYPQAGENVKSQIEKVKDMIVQANIIYQKWKNKGRGSLPSSIETYIKQLIQPRIPFDSLLPRYVTKYTSGKDDFAFSQINKKKFLYTGMVFPTMKSQDLVVVLVIDTSGSISNTELSIFAGGIKKISTMVENIYVITCDCEIQQVIRPGEIDIFLKNVTFKGRGGTSHVPVFEYIDKNLREVDLVICFTDGYTEYPPETPKYPVIWVLTHKNQIPPFGEVIYLDVEDVYSWKP